MGSKVLIEVAQILIRALRDMDIIARYGGDEFVIVLPDTGTKTTYRISKRIQNLIRKHTFLGEDNLTARLTASFGIATYPVHANSKLELIRLADQAMYNVKNRTRDDICIAQSEK